MKPEQKIVAIGAASGILVMLVALFGLFRFAPSLAADADAGERLAFAAQWIAIAAAPLFFAIVAVGNARFLSDAIDPTAGKESRAMIINGRVADNTAQQYLLFIAASLAVAASARGDQLGLVATAALIFVVVRFAFWIGYRLNPLYRAFGMSSTAYLNVALFGTAIWIAAY
jgi:hypothetical protein